MKKQKGLRHRQPLPLPGARSLLAALEALPWIGEIRINADKPTNCYDHLAKLLAVGNHLKLRYYTGGRVQRIDIEVLGGDHAVGDAALAAATEALAPICTADGIDLKLQDEPFEAQESVPLCLVADQSAALRAEIAQLREELDQERQRSAARDQLQREMDAIVQQLQQQTTEAATPVAMPLSDQLTTILRMARAKRIDMASVTDELKEAQAAFAQHEQALIDAAGQEAEYALMRQQLLSRVAETASQNAIEQMEFAYASLQDVIAEQAVAREKAERVRTAADKARETVAGFEQSVAHYPALQRLAKTLQKSCNALIEFCKHLDAAGGEVQTAWRSLEVLARESPDDSLFEDWPCTHQHDTVLVSALVRRTALALKLPADSPKVRELMEPFQQLANAEGEVALSELGGLLLAAAAPSEPMNRAERRNRAFGRKKKK